MGEQSVKDAGESVKLMSLTGCEHYTDLPPWAFSPKVRTRDC